MVKPTLYLLCGVSGSGKSWIAGQLQDKFIYISHDKTPKKQHLSRLLDPNNHSKPLLYDLSVKTSTFIRRHSDKFEIKPVFIIEDQKVIENRLRNRGGKVTESLPKRIKIIQQRAKTYGVFSGTSEEVLNYLMGV